MMKTKWFKVTFPINNLSLIKILQENSFKSNTSNGFELIDYDKSTIVAKFIEKTIVKEVIIDPFGNTETIEITKYFILNFTLYYIANNSHFLILESPPRSIKCFINKLYELMGFGVFLINFSIDISKFIDILKQKYGSHAVRINSIKIGGVYLSNQTSAVIELISNGDLLKDLSNTIKITNNVFFSKAKISISTITGNQDKIEVTRGGSINCTNNSHLELFDILNKLE